MVRRHRTGTVLLAAAVATLLLGACGNAKSTTGKIVTHGTLPATGPHPGVSSNAIVVGALATESGPLSTGFGEIVDGVQAYFDMVNAQGGIDGHLLQLKYNLDDTGSPTNDETQARNLVEQDHVFAIVGVGTPFFSGSQFLGQSGTPTFGYQVSTEWNTYPNMFGAYGSYLDYTTEGPIVAYMANALHAHSAGVVAYSYGASQAPCEAVVSGLHKFGVHVAFQDLNFPLTSTNPSTDVQQMASDHVDFLVSCMAGATNLAFSQSMHQYGQGLQNTHFLWLNGYSRQEVAQDGNVLNGVIFGLQHVPTEAETQFPGAYPAMDSYLAEMNKYEPKWVYDDIAFQGWINAAQFVQGLRAIAPNFTQNRLVDAINEETNFTAGGLIAPVNWSNAHTTAAPPYCGAYVEAENGKTVIVFTTGHQVFVCLTKTSDQAVTPPPDTPGA